MIGVQGGVDWVKACKGGTLLDRDAAGDGCDRAAIRREDTDGYCTIDGNLHALNVIPITSSFPIAPVHSLSQVSTFAEIYGRRSFYCLARYSSHNKAIHRRVPGQ